MSGFHRSSAGTYRWSTPPYSNGSHIKLKSSHSYSYTIITITSEIINSSTYMQFVNSALTMKKKEKLLPPRAHAHLANRKDIAHKPNRSLVWRQRLYIYSRRLCCCCGNDNLLIIQDNIWKPYILRGDIQYTYTTVVWGVPPHVYIHPILG